MTKDELVHWLSVTENSRFKWMEDAVFRLNDRGSFFYTGGENGIYLKIGKDGLLEGGTYEGAVPHIGEAMFRTAATRQYENYSDAFTAAMEAGGKNFLLDMFSADVPAIPSQSVNIEDTDIKIDHVTLEYLDRDAPIKAYIANATEYEDGNLIGIWQPLPTTIDEFIRTLDAIGVKNGEYIADDFETAIPGLEDHLAVCFDIDELNYLAAKLSGMDESELEKFCAALEYTVFRDGLADIINTAENLDSFDLQPAFSEAEYGEFLADMDYDRFGLQIKALEESGNPADREFAAYIGVLEKHFNTEAYGYEQVKKEGGRFTQHGYLTKEKALDETYTGIADIPAEYRVFAYPGAEPKERPSVMDKLAAAKEAAGKINSEKSDTPKKSHDVEL